MNRSPSIGGNVARQVLRWVLSGMFLYAGAAKIRDPHAFSESIASFRLLPPILINPVALTLPPLEILAGMLALSRGRMCRAGAFVLAVMLTVFIAVLASALARSLNVDCGCFGADGLDVLAPTKNLWLALARDVALGATAWFLYVEARRAGPRRS